MKWLGLPTTTHPQQYTIGWLHQGQDLCVKQQCCLPYNIKPFTNEVLCDIAPIDISNVLLGQPYLWKRHAMYESRPREVIVTLGNKLYRIPEVPPPATISLVTTKQCNKLISQTKNFFSWWFTPRERIRLWPRPPDMDSLHENNKWTRLWRSTGTSSPHPQGFLCTVRSSTPLI